MLKLLSAFLSLIATGFIVSVRAYTTVGLSCTNNNTCSGDNEYCYYRRDFDPPCQKGLCACLPGYVLDGIKCTKKVLLESLGENCDLQNFGQFYGVDNADCYGGVVACNPGYVQRNHTCVAETSCTDGRLCPAGMYCDNRQRCSCYYDKKFDLATQTCIKREYGDACRRDTDCQVQGRDFNGFTFRSAVCIDGFCVCGDSGQATTATYIDKATNEYRSKTICVASTAMVEANQGATCTLDPVYWSDIADTVVCRQGHVCYQCPEDYQYPDYGKNFFGKCRQTVRTTLPTSTTTATTTTATSAVTTSPKDFVEIIFNYFTTRRPTTRAPAVRVTAAQTTTSTRRSTTTRHVTTTTTTTPPPATTNIVYEVVTGDQVEEIITSDDDDDNDEKTAEPEQQLTTAQKVPLPIIVTTVRRLPNARTTTKLTFRDDPSTTFAAASPQYACFLPNIQNGQFYASALNGTWTVMSGFDSVLPGAHVTLLCDSGLAPGGGASRSVCLLDGQWSDEFGRCYLPKTTSSTTTQSLPRGAAVPSASTFTGSTLNCNVPVIINGALSTNDSNIVDIYTVKPGSLLSLTCNSGYVVSRGNNESVCLTNGQWWKPLGICMRTTSSLSSNWSRRKR